MSFYPSGWTPSGTDWMQGYCPQIVSLAGSGNSCNNLNGPLSHQCNTMCMDIMSYILGDYSTVLGNSACLDDIGSCTLAANTACAQFCGYYPQNTQQVKEAYMAKQSTTTNVLAYISLGLIIVIIIIFLVMWMVARRGG